MSLAQAWSVALVGVEGRPVEVEVVVSNGLPRTVLVGLPDAALYEARDRCRAAVGSAGYEWPQRLVTINLTPATLPKAGSHYDLAIVVAVLTAGNVIRAGAWCQRYVILGELGLDGRVRPVRGVLPAVLAAREAGFGGVIVPAAQVAEAALVEGIEVAGVRTLKALVDTLRGRADDFVRPGDEPVADDADERPAPDLMDVAGQVDARWALEVAAAGRHHMFLTGPPGVGKTMLAERLPGLLPDLSNAEALEVSAVHSLAGATALDRLLVRPPFSAPHHSASVPSIVGGGARIAKPGAISLAHRGVLFLDEAPQFELKVLDSLRTPLESGSVTLGRTIAQTTYPARFQLILASNPCPCGNANTPGAECRCTAMQVRRYRDRLSGPILDRVDIRQQVMPIRRALLADAMATAEPTEVVAGRVAQARGRQRHRLQGTGWLTNGEVPGPYLRSQLPMPAGAELLDRAVRRGQLSQRGVDKVLRVSWTLADLGGRDRPSRTDLLAALAMRHGEPREQVA